MTPGYWNIDPASGMKVLITLIQTSAVPSPSASPLIVSSSGAFTSQRNRPALVAPVPRKAAVPIHVTPWLPATGLFASINRRSIRSMPSAAEKVKSRMTSVSAGEASAGVCQRKLSLPVPPVMESPRAPHPRACAKGPGWRGPAPQ